MYYVLVENPDPYPPSFNTYLNKLASTIGAEVMWTESNVNVFNNFAKTGKSIYYFLTLYRVFPLMYPHKFYLGDWMRNSRPNLEEVINAGVGPIFLLSVAHLVSL
jgi:hypothetical protein